MMRSGNGRPDVTRSAILAFLGSNGSASRADIARSLGISPALVTQNTKSLIAEGLVEELSTAPSQGGRPARLIGLVSTAGNAVGIKIAPNHITLVEVTIGGEVIRSASEPFDASARTALADVSHRTASFIAGGGERHTVLGVGVGVPGTVDWEDSGVVDSTQLGWVRMPLGEHLRQALGLPVLVDNNVNALALAEGLYGRAHGHESAFVVTLGTGIGSGILYGGQVLRGFRGGAGELGHLPAMENGPQCQCGARGCVEALIGQASLEQQAVERGIAPRADKPSISAIVRLADHGNAEAQSLFASAGHILGRALAAAVNLLSPEVVIILGEGAENWRHWEPGFEGAFRECLVPNSANVPVFVESWQDDRWAQGAASLVLATPFDNRGSLGEQGRLVRERLASSMDV